MSPLGPLGMLAVGALVLLGLGIQKTAHGLKKASAKIVCVLTVGHKCQPKAKRI